MSSLNSHHYQDLCLNKSPPHQQPFTRKRISKSLRFHQQLKKDPDLTVFPWPSAPTCWQLFPWDCQSNWHLWLVLQACGSLNAETLCVTPCLWWQMMCEKLAPFFPVPSDYTIVGKDWHSTPHCKPCEWMSRWFPVARPSPNPFVSLVLSLLRRYLCDTQVFQMSLVLLVWIPSGFSSTFANSFALSVQPSFQTRFHGRLKVKIYRSSSQEFVKKR